jgi:hypothetical protein
VKTQNSEKLPIFKILVLVVFIYLKRFAQNAKDELITRNYYYKLQSTNNYIFFFDKVQTTA